jgi:hypothetical protein
MTPNEPVDENYGDAAFSRDLPISKHIPEEKIQVLYPKYRTDDARTFPGPFACDLGAVQVEAVESGENARPDLPTCGYLITYIEKDISFYHTGDLHATYPALGNLKGRVDYLIHMKTGLKNWPVFAHLLDLVQPRFLIPTHYRTDRKTDPIPEGHWPPDVTDVNAFIESIREHASDRTQILPFTAGVQYEIELPDKKVVWAWDWHNTWTVPPWREG